MIQDKVTATIITIGDELLNGRRVNTNLNWLSSQLHKININTMKGSAIPDSIEQINEELHDASNSDYVFVTGGLGSTSDDQTIEAISHFLKKDTYFDKDYYEKIKKDFINKKLTLTKVIEKQAIKINGVKYFDNPVGSAQGFSFKYKDCMYFILPGVPKEMKYIFINSIKNQLDKKVKKQYSQIIQTFGLTESYISSQIEVSMKKYSDIKFSFLPSFKRVSIILNSENQINIKKARADIVKILGYHVYSLKDKSLLETVVDLIIKKDISVSTCESCTGGQLASLFTKNKGSSKYFKGSIISYCDDIKNTVAKVDSKKIKKFGSVSKQIAKEMAINTSKIMSTDMSISITGLSGPEGDGSHNEVGTVFIGIKYLENIFISQYKLPYERDAHRIITCQIALNNVRLILMNKMGDNIYKFK